MSNWQPLSAREEPYTFEAGPYEGVPEWMQATLSDWVQRAFKTSDSPERYATFWIDSFERLSHTPLGRGSDRERLSKLVALVGSDERVALDVVDYLLSVLNTANSHNELLTFEISILLEQSGSAWRVAEKGDGLQLQRRIGATTGAAHQVALAPSDRAAEHLRLAVGRAFGRSPDPSGAFREAVRAVEAIAKPVILPDDDTATLGKMIARLRDAPNRFDVAVYGGSGGVERLRAMLELLWKGQNDRHGTDAPDAPISVDQRAAEAAVHLAVVVVEWFRSGLVTRTE